MKRRFTFLAKLGIIESNDSEGKYQIQRIDDVQSFAWENNLSFIPPQLKSDEEATAIFNSISIERLNELN